MVNYGYSIALTFAIVIKAIETNRSLNSKSRKNRQLWTFQ